MLARPARIRTARRIGDAPRWRATRRGRSYCRLYLDSRAARDQEKHRLALDRLFGESERVGSVERPPLPTPAEPNDDTGVGPAPPETVGLWVNLVATMGPDELADFEERTFRQNRASLFDPRRAIERRRRELRG